jgi:hypothetical protein
MEWTKIVALCFKTYYYYYYLEQIISPSIATHDRDVCLNNTASPQRYCTLLYLRHVADSPEQISRLTLRTVPVSFSLRWPHTSALLANLP